MTLVQPPRTSDDQRRERRCAETRCAPRRRQSSPVPKHSRQARTSLPDQVTWSAGTPPEGPALVVSPLAFEQACRLALQTNPRRSLQPVLLGVELSMCGRQDWVPLLPLVRRIYPATSTVSNPQGLADAVAKLGFAERRLVHTAGRDRYELRLSCSTVQRDHPDGRCMTSIASDLRVFARRHAMATPLVALILCAIHSRRLSTRDEIGAFLLPECDPRQTPSTYGRLLHQLQDAKLIGLQASGSRPQGQVVFAVRQ